MVGSAQIFTWLQGHKPQMVELLEEWCAINSWTHNPKGLDVMYAALEKAFKPLGADIKPIELKGGRKALSLSRHLDRPLTALLGGHYDTVHPPEEHWEGKIEGNIFHAPGAADMKGGVIVLLYALLAFEHFFPDTKLGWEVLITPDEEIGSPTTRALWGELAERHTFALLFEPALQDGAFAAERSGSANFTIAAEGSSAHAGRDFFEGRSAILALAELSLAAEEMCREQDRISLNIGTINGGISANTVPKRGSIQLNIRAPSDELVSSTTLALMEKISQIEEKRSINFNVNGGVTRPAKRFDFKTASLFQLLYTCGEELNLKIHWKKTGGVCDGNITAFHGLPTIDTLGVRGGKTHSSEEFVELDSLVERSQLTALLLAKFGKGEDPWSTS